MNVPSTTKASIPFARATSRRPPARTPTLSGGLSPATSASEVFTPKCERTIASAAGPQSLSSR
ncbi:MAG TPA: hypothetical protein VLT58_18470, partial [Polyangia bacterium]|nr:hypothetical protein [Polyangia bacterium]